MKPINNPYLKAFEAVTRPLCNKLSHECSHDPKCWYEGRSHRTELVNRYSWAIPNKKAIRTLVKYSPIIEIGAGTGYWASLVQQAGGDIIAFDKSPDGNIYHPRDYSRHFPVQFGTQKKASYYPDRTLFLCWPPYNTQFAYTALKYYQGNRFIYVGEGRGGCTGNDKFHDLLEDRWYVDENEVEWLLEEEVEIPTWSGTNDIMFVYVRRMK